MKFLISAALILLTSSVDANNFHQFSARYRTSPINTISHLDIKNDIGIQFDFKRSVGYVFYEGSIYVSKANVSDTQGFSVGSGFTYKKHSLSTGYHGEQNYEKWRIEEGTCKACNLDWINSNYRASKYIRYTYEYKEFTPLLEYQFVQKDRDEMLDNRLVVGIKYVRKLYDQNIFLSVKYNQHLTTFNIGFKY